MIRPATLGLLVLLSAGAWLGGTLPAREGWLFLAGALPVWLVVVCTLGMVRRQEGHHRPLGLATQLTLGRGLLLSALAGFGPLAWLSPATAISGAVAVIPGLLYTTAALADLVDGYLARRHGEESALGSRLDVAMDALGLVVAPVVAIGLGRLPAFYLMVSAAYYVFHGGHRWRRRRGLPVHLDRLRASRTTRMYAGYQMGLVATVLFPVLGPPGTTLAAAMFMVPNLTLFTRDWLLVTGRLDAENPRYTRLVARAGRVAHDLLLGVRLRAAAGIVAAVVQRQLAPGVLALALALLLGLATRLSAFVASIFIILAAGRDPGALLFATLFVTLLSLLGGGGRAALLRDERWLLARAGERQ
jgi:CDP-diacylglycerol---glycerol-3-phosphate 3-phosphatidyltransferase